MAKKKLNPFDPLISKKRHDEEAASCLEKWKDHFPFEKVDSEYAKQLAIILENQRLMNETSSGHSKIDLQLVFDIYSNLMARHFVSIQTLLGPAGLVYFLAFKEDGDEIKLVLDSEEIAARTKRLETETEWDDENLAAKISNEITREITTDLRNNVGTKALVDPGLDGEGWYFRIKEIKDVIHRKTLLSSDYWILTSPKIGKMLSEYYSGRFPETDDEIFFVSHIGCPLYVDVEFPEDTVLIGLRGREKEDDEDNLWYYEAGYQYSPYVPLTFTPVILDPDTFHPKKGLITRYGKKLLRMGTKYYGLIQVKKDEEKDKPEEASS